MQNLAEHAEPGGDAHRFVDDSLDDHVGRLLRRERGHVVVDLGRRDHRRLNQRHVDGGELDAGVGVFRGGAAGKGVQRRLGSHVGGKARRVGEHANRGNVDHLPLALPGHARQEGQRDPQRAEIVDVHGALEVVKTIRRVLDGAADRAAGIVDEDIDAAVLFVHDGGELGAGLLVPYVGGIGEHLAAILGAGLDLGVGRSELFRITRDDDDVGTSLDDLLGRRQADSRRPAGDHHHLATHLALERAVDHQVGVKMAFPVVPQDPRVVLQAWAGNAGALQGLFGFARIEAGRIVDELHHVLGQAEVLHDRVANPSRRREGHEAFLDPARNEAEQCCVDAHLHARRVRCLAEDVEDVAYPVWIRIGQVESFAVPFFEMHDVVHRGNHEIHRHDVDAPALDADRRHPWGKDLAHLLDQLEEVVGAVDLVHLTGLRVAHDQPWPIYPPRHGAFVARDGFGLVLGGEIRVIQVFGLVEHVLSPYAFVQAGGGDGRHMVEAPGLDRVGEHHGIAGAVDVAGLLFLGRGLEVIDGCEVREVGHLARQFLLLRSRNAEFGLGHVAHDRDGALLIHAPVVEQRGALLVAARPGGAREVVDDCVVARKNLADQPFADESGRPGDEISRTHVCLRKRLPLPVL